MLGSLLVWIHGSFSAAFEVPRMKSCNDCRQCEKHLPVFHESRDPCWCCDLPKKRLQADAELYNFLFERKHPRSQEVHILSISFSGSEWEEHLSLKLHCAAQLVNQEGRGACGYLMGYNCHVGPFLSTSFENTDHHVLHIPWHQRWTTPQQKASEKMLLGFMFQSPTGSQNEVHLVKLELYSIRYQWRFELL